VVQRSQLTSVSREMRLFGVGKRRIMHSLGFAPLSLPQAVPTPPTGCLAWPQERFWRVRGHGAGVTACPASGDRVELGSRNLAFQSVLWLAPLDCCAAYDLCGVVMLISSAHLAPGQLKAGSALLEPPAFKVGSKSPVAFSYRFTGGPASLGLPVLAALLRC